MKSQPVEEKNGSKNRSLLFRSDFRLGFPSRLHFMPLNGMSLLLLPLVLFRSDFHLSFLLDFHRLPLNNKFLLLRPPPKGFTLYTSSLPSHLLAIIQGDLLVLQIYIVQVYNIKCARTLMHLSYTWCLIPEVQSLIHKVHALYMRSYTWRPKPYTWGPSLIHEILYLRSKTLYEQKN